LFPLSPLNDLFSLIGRLASSKAALNAERLRVVSTLESLRTSLISASSESPDPHAVGRFSNAASDLFCHVRLLAASPGNAYVHLEGLANHVEVALSLLQRGVLSHHQSNELLALLEAELGRLQ
jgi:hypothetical protein